MIYIICNYVPYLTLLDMLDYSTMLNNVPYSPIKIELNYI